MKTDIEYRLWATFYGKKKFLYATDSTLKEARDRKCDIAQDGLTIRIEEVTTTFKIVK